MSTSTSTSTSIISHIVLRLLVSARIHQDLHSCGVIENCCLNERCAAKLYTIRRVLKEKHHAKRMRSRDRVQVTPHWREVYELVSEKN